MCFQAGMYALPADVNFSEKCADCLIICWLFQEEVNNWIFNLHIFFRVSPQIKGFMQNCFVSFLTTVKARIFFRRSFHKMSLRECFPYALLKVVLPTIKAGVSIILPSQSFLPEMALSKTVVRYIGIKQMAE